jgi:hypothetical protein
MIVEAIQNLFKEIRDLIRTDIPATTYFNVLIPKVNSLQAKLDKKQSDIAALETERDDLLKALNETGKLLDDTQNKLKAAEEKAALSVPFEVMCRTCVKPHDGTCKISLEFRTPENCPIIPKAKTDE